jgi:nicotinate-nucleotide adenylyltransferase
VALIRKALFGGSFNPPHRAHRALAEAALAQLQLDELIAMPAGQPWQKSGAALAPAGHREAMLRLQLAGLPRCTVSRWEIEQGGPSYSVDTLAALQRPGEQWFLVIGQDQYARLSSWQRWLELLQRCELAVAARAGEAVAADPLLPPHRCHRLDLPADTVSASQVREQLARGDDVTPLVGAQVAGYIADQHLYRV